MPSTEINGQRLCGGSRPCPDAHQRFIPPRETNPYRDTAAGTPAGAAAAAGAGAVAAGSSCATGQIPPCWVTPVAGLAETTAALAPAACCGGAGSWHQQSESLQKSQEKQILSAKGKSNAL